MCWVAAWMELDMDSNPAQFASWRFPGPKNDAKMSMSDVLCGVIDFWLFEL